MNITVGQLRALLNDPELGLPDDAPVLISGRHSLHVCDAEPTYIHPINHYGQAQFSADQERSGVANAFLLSDRSSG
jgi:hypothetical protein